jgi:hypothetical protein
MSAASCGCKLFLEPSSADPLEIELRLPAVPPSWDFLTDLSFTVRWRGGDGLLHERRAAPASTMTIDVERGASQAIVALPVTAAGALRPAGARYPADLAEGNGAWGPPAPVVLALDWRGGWLGEVHRQLELRGHDPERFNLSRLGEELSEPGLDPWQLAPGSAAERLAEGRFSVRLLDPPERFPVVLPGPGPWAFESALAAPPVDEGPDGWKMALPVGQWLLLGPESAIVVGVGEDGAALVVPLAPP